MNKRFKQRAEQTVKRFCRVLTAAMLILLLFILSIPSVIALEVNDVPSQFSKSFNEVNNNSTNEPSFKRYRSVLYHSFEDYEQEIKDGTFFEKHNAPAVPDSIKDTIMNTNLIKPRINGKELEYNYDRDSYGATAQYPELASDPQNYVYIVFYKYPDSEDAIMFQVKYLLDNTSASADTFPEHEKANYDAVINGENVRIYSFTWDDIQHFGVFQYKNMYEVTLMTYDKESFDMVFRNLEIEEISVNNNEAMTNYVWLWIVLGAVSVGAVAAVIVLKKRKQNEA